MKRADRMRTRAFTATDSPTETVAPPQEQEHVIAPVEEVREMKPVLVKRSPDQEARAMITGATQAMDWARAAGYAQQAVTKGHLTEQEVEQAIDAALPDAQKASRLPLHRLLAVASAASPQKRQDYAPLLQNYRGLDTLPQDIKGDIVNHMRLIGLGG